MLTNPRHSREEPYAAVDPRSELQPRGHVERCVQREQLLANREQLTGLNAQGCSRTGRPGLMIGTLVTKQRYRSEA